MLTESLLGSSTRLPSLIFMQKNIEKIDEIGKKCGYISRPCLVFIGQTCISPVTKFGLIIISFAFNYLAGLVMDMGTNYHQTCNASLGNYVKYKDFRAGTKTLPAIFYSSSVKGIRITSVIVSGEGVENVKAALKEVET